VSYSKYPCPIRSPNPTHLITIPNALPLSFLKPYGKNRPFVSGNFNFSFQLFHQSSNQLQPQCFGLPDVKTLGKAHPVIGHLQDKYAVTIPGQFDIYLSLLF